MNENHIAQGPAECRACGRCWRAVWPVDTAHLECPSCGAQVPTLQVPPLPVIERVNGHHVPAMDAAPPDAPTTCGSCGVAFTGNEEVKTCYPPKTQCRACGALTRWASPLFGPDVVRSPPSQAPPEPRDLWPLLIADVETGMKPAPTMDIRQHAAAEKLRARVLEMLRTRAAEAGPVPDVTSTAAIDGAIDALLAVWWVACTAPPKFKPLLQGLFQTQLQVVIGLGALSRNVASGEG